jgi:hypothetical protein
MSITIEVQGGFGNHLLAVWLGCILANKNNMNISIKGNAIHNDSNIQRNDTRTTIYKLLDPTILKPAIGSRVQHISSAEEYLKYLSVNLDKDINYIITLIHINNMSFFLPYIPVLKKYINPDIYNIDYDLSNSIVLSLRLGMGAAEVSQPSPYERELRIPIKYYYDSISKCLEMNPSINKIFILSDNYTDTYIHHFDIFKDNLQIVYCNTKNTYEQFKYIVNATYFISSNSSFSLVSSILNETGAIFIPSFTESGSPFPGIDNKRYATILNTNAPNSIKMLIG